MKLAIVGTRNPGVTYQEWEKLLLDKINPDEIQMVISGGAKGLTLSPNYSRPAITNPTWSSLRSMTFMDDMQL